MSQVGEINAAAPASAQNSGEQVIQPLADAARPYPPSWVDRLTSWVGRLPGSAWLYYVGFAGTLILLRAAIGWTDRSYPFGTFFPVHVMDGVATIYMLLALHYLDDRASAALTSFRPALNLDDAGYENLRYRLTTMPSRPVIAWSLVGLVFGLLNAPLVLTEAQLRAVKYMTSPAASVVDIAVAGFAWVTNAVFAYHTIHQLRLISQIYTRHTKVDVFDSGPMYVLSRLTATTAVVLLFITYLYIAIYSDWEVQTLPAVIAGIFVAIALATFVWPLLGAHRLLQEEKAHWKGEVARRIRAVAGELHRDVDTHDLDDMQALKNAMDGLVAERAVLDKVSTWPWEPETVRVVLTAMLLPMVLWIVTRILERFTGL